MIFAKNFARNYDKKYLEHQILGQWVVHPSDPATQWPSHPATQRIVLKIVRFLDRCMFDQADNPLRQKNILVAHK